MVKVFRKIITLGYGLPWLPSGGGAFFDMKLPKLMAKSIPGHRYPHCTSKHQLRPQTFEYFLKLE